MASGGGQKVGNAYITVTPKLADGFDSKIKEKGTPSGNEYGGKFSSAANKAISVGTVALGNILANAVTSVASTVGSVFSDTFNNYADYEQLVGGVDTLFKESSATVQQYASQAYMTAGMSANQYMEQVTSFSASLLQGLGGDTEAAAQYADMAMRDMSDNANKMGTDMGRITDAYQGFAKQNYTMLDNLKLGYGGTKTEMERLLKDASAIAGVEFNIDNYDDVIEAIHVMQESMGIAGTTYNEARETISGSINMTKAAWANLLTELGKDNGDVAGRVKELVDSAKTALFGYLDEATGEVRGGIVPRIKTIITSAAEYIKGNSDAIAEGAVELFITIVEAIAEVTPAVLEAITRLVVSLVAKVAEHAPEMLAAVGQLLLGVVEGIANGIEPAMTALNDLLQQALDAVGAFFMSLGDAIATALSDIVSGAQDTLTSMQEFVSSIWTSIQSFVGSVINAISATISGVLSGIQAFWSGVWASIQSVAVSIWSGIQNAISTAVNAVKSVINGLSSVVGVVTGIFNSVKQAITDPINTAKQVVTDAINAIKNIINNAHLQLPHFALPHFVIDGGEVPWGIGGQGRKPTIDVQWYAQGGIVDGATLIGAGEAGPEMILPKSGGLMTDFAEAVASQENDEELIRWLSRNLGAIIANNAPTISRRDFDRMARGAIA